MNNNTEIINSGFVVLNSNPEWSSGFRYLEQMITQGSVTHFTEQSAFNLVSQADPKRYLLPGSLFHLSANDHFSFSHVPVDELAIRHFVGPVRFKMWQTGWKQFV